MREILFRGRRTYDQKRLKKFYFGVGKEVK